MQEYDFTLKFNLSHASEDASSYTDALYENGCDDALVGIGKLGCISINFVREAESALAAISSAIENVKAAIPDAVLVEATPDLVGLTDIAQIMKCTRQNVRKIMNSGSDSQVPLPMHEGNPSLWHLACVLEWLKKSEKYQVDDALFSVASLNRSLNAQSRLRLVEPGVQKEAKKLLALAS